jgi:hypothetical protein
MDHKPYSVYFPQGVHFAGNIRGVHVVLELFS